MLNPTKNRSILLPVSSDCEKFRDTCLYKEEYKYYYLLEEHTEAEREDVLIYP